MTDTRFDAVLSHRIPKGSVWITIIIRVNINSRNNNNSRLLCTNVEPIQSAIADRQPSRVGEPHSGLQMVWRLFARQQSESPAWISDGCDTPFGSLPSPGGGGCPDAAAAAAAAAPLFGTKSNFQTSEYRGLRAMSEGVETRCSTS